MLKFDYGPKGVTITSTEVILFVLFLNHFSTFANIFIEQVIQIM